jgi:hypothetical protein
LKEIGNIFLVWRKGSGERRIPVGVIKKNATEGVRFNYLSKGLEEARKYGFVSFEGFPDTTEGKIFTKNVIDIFGQRLMRSERNDINDFYDFWKINKSHKDDSFYMLAHTQGLLPTDNFEFLAEFNAGKNLSFVTEISALSKLQIPSDLVIKGDKLTYELERTNEFDNYAVQLFKNDLFIGYVKLIHSKVFYQSKNKFELTVQHIEKNGVLKRVFIHVRTV